MSTRGHPDRFPGTVQLRHRSGIRRMFGGCILLLVMCIRFSAPTSGQTVEDTQVKAAYLYNFAKFVEWPTRIFPNENSPLVICAIGDEHISDVLERLLSGKKVSGHPVETRRPQSSAELKLCHILFIGFSAKEPIANALNALHGSSVLTVGQNREFIPLGGMINLTLDHATIGLEINPEASQAVGLKISSRLLVVARTVSSSHSVGGGR
ncbi:MAG: YfiR family protein [Terriglobales bacterium]